MRVTQSVLPKARILSIKVTAATKADSLAWIEEYVGMKHKIMVVTPNPEQIILAQKDGSFREILNQASLALCDGEGLRWAARFLEVDPPIPERATGEEVMQELLERAAKKRWKVMLVGGRPGVAQKAVRDLRFKNHDLRVDGFEGIRNIRAYSREENERAVKRINRFKPALLFVAFGAPWQEKWLAQNFNALNIRVGMVVGGALDMIVDPTLRPPAFMTRSGLDWLYRLLRQPWRIRRQLALLRFLFLVAKQRIQ